MNGGTIIEYLFELKNVHHSYRSKDEGSVKVLNGINLDVKDGEFVAIVGPSGGGKSTLLNIMAGIIKPTEGEVILKGDTINLESDKTNIGYISQSDSLLPWRTIIDNVALALEIKGVDKKTRYEHARNLINQAGLSGFENSYPNELSGGMRKRAIIIRALSTQPDIVFMDEPFGPLDVFTAEVLQDLILEMWQKEKNTIIYITHNIQEAITLADRILLLSYRPATIKNEYIVNWDRPRKSSEFNDYPEIISLEKKIKEDIQIEVEKSIEEDINA